MHSGEHILMQVTVASSSRNKQFPGAAVAASSTKQQHMVALQAASRVSQQLYAHSPGLVA